MTKKIAIITVIYENYQTSLNFFSSLKNQTNQNYHLFLANLSKSKAPAEWLEKIPPQNTIIKSENKGYSFGVNLGLKKALQEGYQYFCIINNDTYFKKNFVDSILSSIIDHPSSIIGGKIYYAPGYEYHKNRYQPTDKGQIIWFAGGKIDWNNVITRHIGIDEVDKKQFNQLKNTEFITGCLMIYDKKTLKKVGFWDESYFLYYEDADYCVRAKRKGINLIYDPSIIIWHKNAQSTGGAGSIIHQKYQQKNRLRFGLKYAPFKIKLHLLINLFNKPVFF